MIEHLNDIIILHVTVALSSSSSEIPDYNIVMNRLHICATVSTFIFQSGHVIVLNLLAFPEFRMAG